METYPGYAVCRMRPGYPLESNPNLPVGARWPGYEVVSRHESRAEAEGASLWRAKGQQVVVNLRRIEA